MKIKAFVVTRNEHDLIEDFVTYYAELFGMDNVHVIDDRSDHPGVLDVYERYAKRGLRVHRAGSYKNTGQGDAFTAAMRAEAASCDAMVALDTDEFLCAVAPSSADGLASSVSCSPPLVRTAVEELLSKPDVGGVRLFASRWRSACDPDSPHYVDNRILRPARNSTAFVPEPPVPKWIFASSAYGETSNGNHRGNLRRGKVADADGRLGILHFHDTGGRRNYERCEQIVYGYEYVRPSWPLERRIEHVRANWRKWKNGRHRALQYLRFLIAERLLRECERRGLAKPNLDTVTAAAWSSPPTWNSAETVLAALPPGDYKFSFGDVFRDLPLNPDADRFHGLSAALEAATTSRTA